MPAEVRDEFRVGSYLVLLAEQSLQASFADNDLVSDSSDYCFAFLETRERGRFRSIWVPPGVPQLSGASPIGTDKEDAFALVFAEDRLLSFLPTGPLNTETTCDLWLQEQLASGQARFGRHRPLGRAGARQRAYTALGLGASRAVRVEVPAPGAMPDVPSS